MADPIRRLKEQHDDDDPLTSSTGRVHARSRARSRGALLVSGFALGQIAPNLVEMIGGPLDSARTEAIAPALTTADDYATRQGAIAPSLTTADDYATRHRER